MENNNREYQQQKKDHPWNKNEWKTTGGSESVLIILEQQQRWRWRWRRPMK